MAQQTIPPVLLSTWIKAQQRRDTSTGATQQLKKRKQKLVVEREQAQKKLKPNQFQLDSHKKTKWGNGVDKLKKKRKTKQEDESVLYQK